MNVKRGFSLRINGRPSEEIIELPLAPELFIPLQSKRFRFSRVVVSEGAVAGRGTCLAVDPDQFNIPLLAPVAGVVSLEKPGHITLKTKTEVADTDSQKDYSGYFPDENGNDNPVLSFVKRGLWHYFQDAFKGTVPNPSIPVQALIISTIRLEPFVSRGDTLLRSRLSQFVKGLIEIQKILEYQPIFLAVPKINSELARKVQDAVKGLAWIRVVEIPLKYPSDHPTIICKKLKLSRDISKGSVLVSGVDGVLAIAQSFSGNEPVSNRIVAVSGPAVKKPSHCSIPVGYPMEAILSHFTLNNDPVQVINGGVLTGSPLNGEMMGLDLECQGLMLVSKPREREFLGFMHPGLSRSSYSRAFLSAIRPPFKESPPTALRGEKRPCVACTFCSEVCPSGIFPYRIHKLLYAGEIEEVEKARPDLCIGCGLCSYVCPSKIELCKEIKDAFEVISRELSEKDAD